MSKVPMVLIQAPLVNAMAETICGNCDRMLDTEDFDVEPCQDCGEWHFCERCTKELKKYPPHLVMCQSCEIDYQDAMNESDDDF